MSGGDMRVRNQGGAGGLGIVNQQEVIDAHSKEAGDFTQMRNVGGSEVWLTADGAKAYDGLVKEGYDFRTEKDPSGLGKFFGGDFTGPKGEQFQGKVK